MAVLKLQLEEFNEVDYELVAIHSSLDDYRLAYHINQKLPILLHRNKDEVSVKVKEGNAFFSIYTFEDYIENSKWSLIQNKCNINLIQKNAKQSLFNDSTSLTSQKVFLISEHKKVDYFLKIENNTTNLTIKTIVLHLNQIEQISTAYSLIPEIIKSKNNLIF
jgi:hypothetical protein